MRLAPLLLLASTLVACGSPMLPAGSAPRAPAATAADTEEMSLEISALM